MLHPSHALPGWRQLRSFPRLNPADVRLALHIISPPVDIKGILTRLGVIHHRAPQPGWAAAVSSTDSHAEMWVDAAIPAMMERCLMAQALGHLLLHPLERAYRVTSFNPGTSALSREAHAFAIKLLMPGWMMEVGMQSTGGVPQRMARLFDVPDDVMTRRLLDGQ